MQETCQLTFRDFIAGCKAEEAVIHQLVMLKFLVGLPGTASLGKPQFWIDVPEVFVE